MVMYEKQPILDKFKTVLNFSRHISYSIKTLFRGLLSSSDSHTYLFIPLSLLPSHSHYRVYTIRLSSRSPPPVPPNSLYRSDDDSRLSTYDIVSEENPFEDSTSNYLGYIAAEIDAREFKPLFTIGDKSQTDVAAFANDKLHPSSPYTFFLRAYPKTRGDSPSRSKRQGGTPTRQYVVFSTSNFSEVITTGEYIQFPS